ncbi:hypothetical protein ERX35_007995 [Macrococcus equipercicus]|uniref:Uncharacterized protein n=1 Tax=Macrococcus equipercicus TaxID=69967 RepID=A0ABQ6R7S7_9STAP|nr:hypothetical protein [Macrococcus equipercicus]KAA1039147.1 hypothetical protein ERX35_007995 [Macrococcus equipercicus]
MVKVICGEMIRVEQMGFKERKGVLLEYEKEIQDFRFYIKFDSKGWTLTVTRLNNAMDCVKNVFIKTYDALDPLVEKYERLIELNKLESGSNDDISHK